MVVIQDDRINARVVLRFPLRRLLLVVLTLWYSPLASRRAGAADGHQSERFGNSRVPGVGFKCRCQPSLFRTDSSAT